MLEPFVEHKGLALPLDRPNVDTDLIIPKQYLKAIGRTGFGVNLFDDVRYLDPGKPGDDHSRRRPNPDFVLNHPRYAGASILLGRNNFGCGSSREHAVWALLEYGIRVVVAESYADIFYSNACKNGLLAITLPADAVQGLFAQVEATPGYQLHVSLEKRRMTLPDGGSMEFAIKDGVRERLLHGLDEIGASLQRLEQIKSYEQRRRQQAPWLFAGGSDSKA